MGFPKLSHNPVRYEGETLNCSICRKEITYAETNQLWITLRIATDTVPLLVNSCSVECENLLPKPPENYVQHAHKGGSVLIQPDDENTAWEKRKETSVETNDIIILQENPAISPGNSIFKQGILKVVWKICKK